MKTMVFFTFLTFTKIHLEKAHFIFVTRITLFELSAIFLSHVCSDFNIFFFAVPLASIYQPRSARQINCPNQIFASYKNML